MQRLWLYLEENIRFTVIDQFNPFQKNPEKHKRKTEKESKSPFMELLSCKNQAETCMYFQNGELRILASCLKYLVINRCK